MVPAIQNKKEIVMNTFLKNIVWLFIIAPAIYLAIIWNRLPERVAIHFNLKGEPDRYGGKNELIIMALVIAAITAIIYLLLPLVYKIDPKKTAVANKTRLQRIAFAIAVFMSFISFVVITGILRGNMKFNVRLVFAGIGILF